jgi:PAS domain S-box-containing protein
VNRHAAWLVFLTLAAGSAAAEPRHVLLLHSYERETGPLGVAAEIFQTELSRQSPEPVEFFNVTLAAARLSNTPQYEPLADYLRSTFAGHRIDLVVTIGGPAAQFAREFRQRLFPATPLLLAATDQRFLLSGTLGVNDTAVAAAYDPSEMIETALRLLPETTSVFVVIGASAWERFWLAEMQRGFQRFQDRLTFVWLNELSFAEMLVRSAALPARSLIFYALLSIDANGVPHVEERALAELHEVANAPMFGIHSSQLGNGIVGGPLMSIEELAVESAHVALRILDGDSLATIKAATHVAGTPTFDWRELRRWGISEDRLPPGSLVQFREATMWQRYRWRIVGGASLALVETILVIALLTIHIKRKRAEHLLRESEGRFRLWADTAPVMVWMSDPDMRCTDVNRVWLDFTGRTIEQELGDGWSDSAHADDLKDVLETCRQAFDRREPFRLEFRLRRYDGEYRWILATGVPRLTPTGSFVGYIGSGVDVTDLKLAKAALSGLSRRLMEAHESERAWIARELQDDLSQRLVGLTMQLHSVRQAATIDRDEIHGRVGDLCDQFADLGRDIQAVSQRLDSHKLDILGLAAAVSDYCQELSEQRGVTIDFTDDGVPGDLTARIAPVLFRVLQEALLNAVKHSGARHVAVRLRGSRQEIQLEVSDNGIGFDSDIAMKGHGLGLLDMRERLNLIKGELSVQSSPGDGTRIVVRVPLLQAATTLVPGPG